MDDGRLLAAGGGQLERFSIKYCPYNMFVDLICSCWCLTSYHGNVSCIINPLNFEWWHHARKTVSAKTGHLCGSPLDCPHIDHKCRVFLSCCEPQQAFVGNSSKTQVSPNSSYRTTHLVVCSFWNFGYSTTMKLSYSVQNCQTIWQLSNKHYGDVIMVGWRLKWPASRLFAQTFIKRNIKAPRHWPLWGAVTGDRWIRRTKGQ